LLVHLRCQQDDFTPKRYVTLLQSPSFVTMFPFAEECLLYLCLFVNEKIPLCQNVHLSLHIFFDVSFHRIIFPVYLHLVVDEIIPLFIFIIVGNFVMLHTLY